MSLATKIHDSFVRGVHATQRGIYTGFVKGKHQADRALEPFAAGAIGVLGMEQILDVSIDQLSRGNLIGLVTLGATTALVGGIGLAEQRTHFIREGLKQRWEQYGEYVRRTIPPGFMTGSPLVDWLRTPAILGFGLLATVATFDNTVELGYRVIDNIKNPPNIARPVPDARPVRTLLQTPSPSVPSQPTPTPDTLPLRAQTPETESMMKAMINAKIHEAIVLRDARITFERQIEAYNGDYRKFVDKYFARFLVGPYNKGRISKEDIFGLMRWESGIIELRGRESGQFAISHLGAAGLMQVMPYAAWKDREVCGTNIYYPAYMAKAVRENDKDVFKEYANDLKKQRRLLTRRGLITRHGLFDAEGNICHGIREIEFLLRKFPRFEKPDIVSAYHRSSTSIIQAMEITRSQNLEGYQFRFSDVDSRDYFGRVKAGSVVYAVTPNGKLKDPNFYKDEFARRYAEFMNVANIPLAERAVRAAERQPQTQSVPNTTSPTIDCSAQHYVKPTGQTFHEIAGGYVGVRARDIAYCNPGMQNPPPGRWINVPKAALARSR